MKKREAYKDESENECHIPPMYEMPVAHILEVIDNMLNKHGLGIEADCLGDLIVAFRLYRRRKNAATRSKRA